MLGDCVEAPVRGDQFVGETAAGQDTKKTDNTIGADGTAHDSEPGGTQQQEQQRKNNATGDNSNSPCDTLLDTPVPRPTYFLLRQRVLGVVQTLRTAAAISPASLANQLKLLLQAKEPAMERLVRKLIKAGGIFPGAVPEEGCNFCEKEPGEEEESGGEDLAIPSGLAMVLRKKTERVYLNFGDIFGDGKLDAPFSIDVSEEDWGEEVGGGAPPLLET